MKQANTMPSQDYLREALDYNPLTGELIWKQRPRNHFNNANGFARWNGNFPGKPAGHKNKTLNYRHYIAINGVFYLASRIIWKIVTGEEPDKYIDHKDNEESNDAWNNLRLASESQNQQNKSIRKDSVSGYKGVEKVVRKNGLVRYVAYIRINGKKVYLGRFATPEEAYEVWYTTAKQLHGEFFNPG